MSSADNTRRLEGDVEVTLGDQKLINRFARLNAKCEELEADLSAAERRLENSSEALDELALEDESVWIRSGEVFARMTSDGAQEWIEGLRQKKRVVVVGDVPQLMRLLDAGRIDAFPAILVGSAAPTRLYGPHASLRRLRWFANKPAAEAGLLLSRSTLDDAVRDAIGRALHDMHEDGTLATIVARYVPDRKEAESMLIPLK